MSAGLAGARAPWSYPPGVRFVALVVQTCRVRNAAISQRVIRSASIDSASLLSPVPLQAPD
eukprot:4612170-Lingulodinium_polyedra.AAC.1